MPRVHVRTFGCQMNEYDSARMADVLRESGGLRADRRAGGGGPAAAEHLLGAREGAGEGLLAARPVAIAEARAARRDHRRGRLRGEPGRRGHHRPRAVRRPRVRPADAAPPARHDHAVEARRTLRRGRELPRDREVRPPARAAGRGRHRVRLGDGGLQQVLHVLRGSLHARRRSEPPARAGHGRGARARAPGRVRDHAARPERQCLSRRAARRRTRRSRRAHLLRGRGARDRAHPLHDLAPGRVPRQPGRGLSRRAAARELPAPARCRADRTASWR